MGKHFQVQKTATEKVVDIVYKIQAWDPLEAEHIADTLAWIKSGVPIFRLAKPDIPKQHLVVYFVLFDPEAQKILLVDHKS